MIRSDDSSSGDERPSVMSPEIAAEAAVWIARLHGPERSAQMERDCRDWQARSAAHRLAFERCTEIWQAVPQVSLSDAYASASVPPDSWLRPDLRMRRRGRWLWVFVLVLTAAVGSWWHGWRWDPSFVTGIGEQRSVVLGDGSRLSMNTNTRVDVELGAAQRRVTIRSGEAIFDVAKEANRPFIVRVAGSEIVAHGTAFAVRYTASNVDGHRSLTVTLIQGQASVRPAQEDPRASPLSGGPELQGRELTPVREVQLEPGERIRLSPPCGRKDGPVTLTRDHPRLEQLTAWKRSEVVLDDMSLADAVGEMNRYSASPIVLQGDPALAKLRVAGTFRAGDSEGFARAVAALHDLRVQEGAGRLELRRPQ